MILLDANILMYAAGADHRCKRPSMELLDEIAEGRIEAAVDAEILQEILHRYRALGRWVEGKRLYDLTRIVLPTVLPITDGVLDVTRNLLDHHTRLTARDAVHVAVCKTYELEAICSYDRDFDRIDGLKRVEPPAARSE